MYIALFAFLGACFASFIPCYSERRHLHLSQFDHSRCLNCGHKISPIHLIPILGYFFTRCHCPHCSMKISPFYPTIELVGALSGGIFYELSYNPLKATLLLLISANLLLLSLDDIYNQEINDIDLIILGLICTTYVFLASSQPLVIHLLGSIIISLPLLIVKLMHPDSLGSGDIIFMAICGFALSLLYIAYSFLISTLLALCYSLYLLVSHKATKKTAIPFIPFLAIGVYAMQFCL